MNFQNPNGFHTILVSDLHLGSRLSRSEEFFAFLQSLQQDRFRYKFTQLILLGDIFDDLNFSRFRKFEWKIIGLIRNINDRKSNAKAVWIRGNHDSAIVNLMSQLVGVAVHEEFQWQVGEKRYLAMHGDQFDKWIQNWPKFSKIPSNIYNFIQKFDGKRHHLSRFLKDKSKTWLRINKSVAEGIVRYARSRNYRLDAVFCGHTHIAESFNQDGVVYFNAGCWTGEHAPTYITVSHTSEINITEFKAEK
ncbi:UDP-2,3-diacylglucosamine diphosphatase [Candidatus Parcubacteria bacterium]|jgi:UDP-2,3-diacylglucosamine pyrophosphatase LpxH|nr:MAG: UDP-2,3-diacylglucosamine diphosphatase [Candidatus Parcubacteria bacterium]